jgi:hypothetical protein
VFLKERNVMTVWDAQFCHDTQTYGNEGIKSGRKIPKSRVRGDGMTPVGYLSSSACPPDWITG